MTLKELIQHLQEIEKEHGDELECVVDLNTACYPSHYPVEKIEARKEFIVEKGEVFVNKFCVIIE